MTKISWLMLVACLLVGGCLCGCAQKTNTVSEQPIVQEPKQDSRQAQQGVNSQNYVYVYNAPQGKKLPGSNDGPTVVLHGWPGNDPTSTQPAQLNGLEADSNGAEFESASASGQLQAGISIVINTTGSGSNDMTPSQGSQTAKPNSNQTVTPNQEPTANVTVPIAVGMPGSAPQASGQGQIGSGSQNFSPQQQAELKTLLANVKAGVPGAIEALTKFLETPTKPVQP